MMGENKTTSRQTARKILRRTLKDLAAAREALAKARPGIAAELAAECVRTCEDWVSGRSVPVGVTNGAWAEATAEHAAREALAQAEPGDTTPPKYPPAPKQPGRLFDN